MVDRLTYTDERTGRSAFEIRSENVLVQAGALTASGLLENIAQTAAARIGYLCRAEDRPVPIGYLGAIQHLSIFELPKINDQISTEITIKNQIFNITVIEGIIHCHERTFAQCEMKIFISNTS